MDLSNDIKIKENIKNIDIEYYALSYYKTYFMDDSEIHAIVNFTRRTTTRITCLGNMLNVSILEYVDKEEHDAKALFGGMLIRDFYVYIDNGDIELIGNKEDIIDTQEVELIDIELSEDDFIADVKEAIKGDVGVDEKISKVTFENGDLCVYVDFSKMDPTPLTKEDMALARTSTITDSILELTQYEPMWKTITIDFGEVGYIKNGKDNIEESILGKCFDDVNFVIEH